MPQKKKLQYKTLTEDLLKHLHNGPLSARDACRYLGISQSTFSRVAARLKGELLVAGRAGKTQYALKREIPNVGSDVILYEIDEKGKASRLATLHSIQPKGFCFKTQEGESRFFDDLPYFLEDLRPSGFLGRLIPRVHPQFHFPRDINEWSANHCLQYLTEFGWDLIGNFILGDKAFQLYLEKIKGDRNPVSSRNRARSYCRMAVDILKFGDAGSSAGGEQPKFLTIKNPGLKPVLVKFSPRVEDKISRRRADLLICEHIALKVINQYRALAAQSSLVFGGGRIFLELERFDRTGTLGRQGLISLKALDAEFVGSGRNWVEAARGLWKQNIISRKIYDDIRWLELFGNLIGNTDMHLSNLSFHTCQTKVLDLAPAYDMLPMLYAPQSEQIIERKLEPSPPQPSDALYWKEVSTAAKDFWNQVSVCKRISSEFRGIARVNLKTIHSLQNLDGLLPSV